MSSDFAADRSLVDAIPIVTGLGFPEGPRWHDDLLWFSDIDEQVVYAVDESGAVREECPLDDSPSGLGFLPDGDLLIVLMHERVLLRRTREGAVRMHTDLTRMPGDFINDMVVDAGGAAYVGTRTKGVDPRYPGMLTDTLVHVSPDGAPRVVARDLVAPNGAIITGDGRLIVAETYAHRLTQFAIGPDGELTRRRTYFELPGMFADGICADPSGAVWVGSPYSSQLVRVNPDGSATSLSTDGYLAVACAFGGTTSDSLFLTTVAPATMRKVWSESAGGYIFDPDAPPRTGAVRKLDVTRPGVDGHRTGASSGRVAPRTGFHQREK